MVKRRAKGWTVSAIAEVIHPGTEEGLRAIPS
jgi:hypothetical protein